MSAPYTPEHDPHTSGTPNIQSPTPKSTVHGLTQTHKLVHRPTHLQTLTHTHYHTQPHRFPTLTHTANNCVHVTCADTYSFTHVCVHTRHGDEGVGENTEGGTQTTTPTYFKFLEI